MTEIVYQLIDTMPYAQSLNPEPRTFEPCNGYNVTDIPLQENILRGNITPFSTLLSMVNHVYPRRV
jgi:hypothetical protein